MSNMTIQAETEPEFQKIMSSLEDRGIPFTVKKFSDTTFPSLDQINPYATITVPQAYEADVADILMSKGGDEEPRGNETNRAASRKKNKFGLILLIAYSALATIFLIKYWYIHRNTSEDKNFVYEWSLDNTRLYATSKKTGKDAYWYIDDNYNFNYEKMFSYSPSGNTILRGYDMNEDGFYEEAYNFNLEGQLTTTQLDTNHDSIIDNMEIVLENGDTLKFVDTNYNGFLEVIRAN